MVITHCRTLTIGIAALFAVGCATSQDIVVNPANAGHPLKSAYLVAHGDKSSDVDAAIQKELFRRGIAVSAGPDVRQVESADAIIKFVDAWNWDMAMYLRALDIQVYDARSGVLLASASWKNSAMHGFHGMDGVVAELVDGILKKLGH
jgi:hypothetical protein